MAAPGTSRSRSVLYVVVLSALTLLAAQRIVQPLRGRVQNSMAKLDAVGGRAAAPVNKALKQRLTYDEQVKEIARLAAELDRAKASSLRYDDAVRERRELLALNGLEDPDGYKSVPARIIGSALNNVDQTIRIKVGAGSGVAKGNPVVSAAGLVGRIVEVSKTTATVMLITDPEMSIGVRFGLSGEVAIGRGQGRGDPLRLDLVALDAEVAKGDALVTSGLQNGRFPPGIPVGRVQVVRPGSINQEVTVRPAVDLARIVFVRVLLRNSPT